MATINGTSVGGMTLQIDYSYTQNTTANTSTVTAKLQLVSHYALYATALSGSYISVGGSRTDYSTSINYGGSGTTTTVLATKTVTVSHNSNGTGTCNLSGTFVMNGTYRGYSVGTMTVSSTITLPTIPRASGLTVPTSINTGSALSGTVSPSSTSFNHKVELKIGSTVKQTITLATGTNTFSVTIPHSWIPNSTSATISVVLSTYSGTTFIASTTKNVTANVPASVVPSVSAFTATSSVTSGTFANLYVQGKTTAKLTATATAGDGSSISSYTYSGSGINTTVTTNTVTTSTLQATGTQTYTVSVKDARGRTASKTVSITVYPYAAPSIGPVSVQRCDASGNLTESGTYAKYTVNSAYSTVNSKNTRTVTVAHSSNNGTSYSAETTLQAATDTASTKTGVYGDGAFAIASAYVLRFTIKDTYGATKTITAPLQSAARPINIRSNGKGVSIGAMSTKDAFEVSMDADFNKNVNIDGKLTLTGGLASALSIANGGTGATTATGIAKSHYHTNVGVANAGGGTSGYLKIATISVATANMNQPIEFKIARRGDKMSTDISVAFQNTSSTDPSITNFNRYGVAPAWIYKVSAGVWDLYVQKNEGWDNVSILSINKGEYLNPVTVTLTNVHVSALPSGATQANSIDFVEEFKTSGVWSYRKWNSGFAECWGYHTVSGININTAWGSWYASPTITLPSFPFTFVGAPDLHVGWESDFSAIIDGVGKRESTKAGQVYLYRPVAQTNVNGRFSIYAYGKWK